MRKASAKIVIGTALLLVAAVLAGSLGWLRVTTGLPRMSAVDGLSNESSFHTVVFREEDQARFRKELAPLLHGKASIEEQVLTILRWVMNQVPVIESTYFRSSWRMVDHGRAGGGLLCGGMAQVMRDALLANGIVARSLTMQRNVFDTRDTHAVVEVWIDGKWRLFDPTFHVALRSDGERVGAHEARDWFIKGKGRPVEIEFLGEVKYPARLESYPLRYGTFFNNVYVDMAEPLLSPVPVVGGWLSRSLAYEKDELSSDAQRLYESLYWATVVWLPTVCGALFIAWLAVRKI